MADKTLQNVQISIFCGSMAMMLRSGVPMGEACMLFAGDERGKAAQAARQISQGLDHEMSFTEAAEKTGVFPPYALGVFQIAEQSGRLDEALDRLGDYYERQESLTQRLKSTLTYPVVLMLLMCVVLGILVFTVLPMFEKVYNSITGSLAASSYAYVSAASLLGRASLVAAVLISGILLSLVLVARTPAGREKLRYPMEHFNLTQNAAWLMAISKLTDTLSTLLASGTNQDMAMELALELIEHKQLRKVLQPCLEKMRQGYGLADSLFRCGVLPPLYGRMLIGGSESGNLNATLEDLSNRMGRDAEAELVSIIDAIEPVLIGFLTVSVGLTLLSVMLPLLGILGSV